MEKDIETVGNIKYILEAYKLIGNKKGNRGTIECPKCKNELHFSRASSNGHVWGKCKTDNCLSWMQ